MSCVDLVKASRCYNSNTIILSKTTISTSTLSIARLLLQNINLTAKNVVIRGIVADVQETTLTLTDTISEWHGVEIDPESV